MSSDKIKQPGYQVGKDWYVYGGQVTIDGEQINNHLLITEPRTIAQDNERGKQE